MMMLQVTSLILAHLLCEASGVHTQDNRVKIDNVFTPAVGISPDYVVVGSLINVEKGEGFVDVRENKVGYASVRTLVPDDMEKSDFFGSSVAVNKHFIVIGSRKDDEKYVDQGSVYVYKISGNSWKYDKLVANDAAEGDQFGFSVDINDDNELVVGAKFARMRRRKTGAAYLFKYVNDKWIQKQKLVPNGVTFFDYLGHAVSITKDYIAVSAHRQSTMTRLNPDFKYTYRAGKVYVYKRNKNDDMWEVETSIISPFPQDRGYFGRSLSIDGKRLVVGASNQLKSQGNAYVFTAAGGTWKLESELIPKDQMKLMYFGYSVAIHKNSIVVGTWYDGDSSTVGHVFNLSNGQWVENRKLVTNEVSEVMSVDIFDGNIVVGCETYERWHSGSSYVFPRPS